MRAGDPAPRRRAIERRRRAAPPAPRPRRRRIARSDAPAHRGPAAPGGAAGPRAAGPSSHLRPGRAHQRAPLDPPVAGGRAPPGGPPPPPPPGRPLGGAPPARRGGGVGPALGAPGRAPRGVGRKRAEAEGVPLGPDEGAVGARGDPAAPAPVLALRPAGRPPPAD